MHADVPTNDLTLLVHRIYYFSHLSIRTDSDEDKQSEDDVNDSGDLTGSPSQDRERERLVRRPHSQSLAETEGDRDDDEEDVAIDVDDENSDDDLAPLAGGRGVYPMKVGGESGSPEGSGKTIGGSGKDSYSNKGDKSIRPRGENGSTSYTSHSHNPARVVPLQPQVQDMHNGHGSNNNSDTEEMQRQRIHDLHRHDHIPAARPSSGGKHLAPLERNSVHTTTTQPTSIDSTQYQKKQQAAAAGYLMGSPLTDWIQLTQGLQTPMSATTAGTGSNNLPPMLSVREGSQSHFSQLSYPNTLSTPLSLLGPLSALPAGSAASVTGGGAFTAAAYSALDSSSSSGRYLSSMPTNNAADTAAAMLRPSRFSFYPDEVQSSTGPVSLHLQATTTSTSTAAASQEPSLANSMELLQQGGLRGTNGSNGPGDIQQLKKSLHLALQSPVTPSQISMSWNTPSEQTLKQRQLQQQSMQASSRLPPVAQSLDAGSSTSAGPTGHITAGTTVGSSSGQNQLVSRSLALEVPPSHTQNNSNGYSQAMPPLRQQSSIKHLHGQQHNNFHTNNNLNASISTTRSQAVLSSAGAGIASSGNIGSGISPRPLSSGKRTSSFRSAGDLLLAKNIMDAQVVPGASSGLGGLSRPEAASVGSMTPSSMENSSNNQTHTNTSTNTNASTNNSSAALANGGSRMFALAAALDAGDAVGQLMAEMMMMNPTSTKQPPQPQAQPQPLQQSGSQRTSGLHTGAQVQKPTRLR